MAARRALVVDDSRSARAFLTRVLERYELAVDGVESAEQAIEYLTHQRPDVIFMDHLMPGMDGFQAVQAIKNNPRTATIPIMMYTSQEGELYLSQARALGAIGVLPKQIKHADVSKALDQLRLLGETKPETETGSVADAQGPPAAPAPPPSAALDPASVAEIMAERRAPSRPAAPALTPDLRAVIDAMIGHHLLEMRRFLSDALESQADRVVGDLRLLAQDAPPPPAPPPPRSAGLGMGTWLGMVGLLLAGLFALQWARERSAAALLTTQLATARQQLDQTQQTLQALQAADAAAAASAAAPATEAANDAAAAAASNSMIEPVPFGETPLAGARMERVASLLSRLNAQGFHGTVQIRSIPGRFCLMMGTGGVPVLASDATLYNKCELVGNPRDDNTTASQRESVAFANMLSTARHNAEGKIDVQISAGSPDEVLTPYPPASDTLTAGEWNHVAAANNRIDVHWLPSR
jgi:CheY-like chemotaxis protein